MPAEWQSGSSERIGQPARMLIPAITDHVHGLSPAAGLARPAGKRIRHTRVELLVGIAQRQQPRAEVRQRAVDASPCASRNV